MELSNIRERARQLVQSLAVVCVAFVLSQLFYVGIAWFLVQGSTAMDPMAPSLPGVVSWALAAVAVGLVVVAPAIQSLLLRRVRDGGDSLDEYLQRYRAAAIVGYAVREGPGVVGLALSLLTGDLGWSLGLGLLAVLALLAAWPRPGPVEEGALALAVSLEGEAGTGLFRQSG